MKKMILGLLIALFVGGTLSAQEKGVQWEKGTFQEALNKAAKEGKMVFMDAYASWCGPCKFMAAEIFPQAEAGKFFNAKFVNIKIDMEKGEGPALAKQYKVSLYPTFLILDAKGDIKGRLAGSSRSVDEFIKRVNDALAGKPEPRKK